MSRVRPRRAAQSSSGRGVVGGRLAEACLQRVDIPGRDSHPQSVAFRRPRPNAAWRSRAGTRATRTGSVARQPRGLDQGMDGQLIAWAPELTGKLSVLTVPHTTKPTMP